MVLTVMIKFYIYTMSHSKTYTNLSNDHIKYCIIPSKNKLIYTLYINFSMKKVGKII